MPITLQEAKVGMTDKVDQQVIDLFQRSSLLLDRLTFDNSISPGTGGSTLAYGYIQLKTPSTAAVRTINTEYKPGEAKREEKSTKAIIMGGSFEVDRVIQNTSGAIDEMAFQAEEKIKATANYFHYIVINGTKDTGVGLVPNTFDGLKKLLKGTQNVFKSEVDLTTSEKMDLNSQAFLDELDALVASVDGASMLLMNEKMLLKVRSCARRAGYYERTKDDFGRVVEMYNGIPMVDTGGYYDAAKGKTVEAVGIDEGTGKTSIYAVSLGLNGLHGISPTGSKMINSYLPNMSDPGAVKKGEVELVAGIALKNTRKAAVLEDIPIVAVGP